MNYENIIVKKIGDILLITINRPTQLNALNKVTLKEFENVMEFAINNENVKGIIITGAGNKAFIAGADIKEFSNYTVDEGREMVINGQRVLKFVEESPKPVIAAINGYALGGGCELAMSCHLRIASENATFGQPEVDLGIIPGYGGTQRLVQLIGKSKAIELLMTSKMIDVKEAKNLGLVNYITSPDNLITKSIEVLKIILSKSPEAIRGIINSVNAYFSEESNGYHIEIEEFSECFGSKNFKEGVNAFLEKRKPQFK